MKDSPSPHRSPIYLPGCLVIGVLALALAGPARAGSCPGGWINTGDLLPQVHLKCGDPTFWDQRLEEVRVTTRNGMQMDRSRTVDEWTYDLGPDRLIQILVFHDGKLVRERTGGYGGLAGRAKGDRPALISVGHSKAMVLLRWGEPTYQEQYTKTRATPGPRRSMIERSVLIERFTYDLGPQRLIRILTFENGKLVKKQTAGRGTQVAQSH